LSFVFHFNALYKYWLIPMAITPWVWYALIKYSIEVLEIKKEISTKRP